MYSRIAGDAVKLAIRTLEEYLLGKCAGGLKKE